MNKEVFQHPLLSIIIVSYNCKDLLFSCLTSINKFYSDMNFEIIVIDNNSQDGTMEMIKDNFSELKLKVLSENSGFAKANNIGIKESKGKYILLLNPDTMFYNSSLNDSIDLITSDSGIQILGCHVHNSDRSSQNSTGNFPSLLSLLLQALWLDRIPFIKNHARILSLPSTLLSEKTEVDWISGAFMLINKSVFKDVGLLSEDYFMYYEDVDWCYRAKKKGYKIWFNIGTDIIHYGNSNIKKSFSCIGPIVKTGRSQLLFFQEYSPHKVFALRLIMMIESVVKIIGGICLTCVPSKNKLGLEYIKAYYQYFKIAIYR